jgi:hypothetical protein
MSKETASLLGPQWSGRRFCADNDMRLYAIASPTSDPFVFEVDVRHESAPCGDSWECWAGPWFYGVYTVRVALQPAVLSYRGYVADWNLLVPAEEYDRRAAQTAARFGLKGDP